MLEAGPAPGGHAQTTVADGFVVEAGPNGFLNREPETMALVDALDLGARLVEARPEAKRRFIVRGGQLCQVPDGPLGLVTSTALTWRGKLRLAGRAVRGGAAARDRRERARVRHPPSRC